VTKPKRLPHWPLAGERPRPVSRDEICARFNFSLSHLARIEDAPEFFDVGERAQRGMSDEWDAWEAARREAARQRKLAKAAPAEPKLLEPPRRKRGRPRKSVATAVSPG
jgi:hypothetical protein